MLNRWVTPMIKRSPGGVVAGSLRCGSSLLALAGLATSSLGANIVWEGGALGDYAEPTNWAGDMVPAFGDTLVFDTPPSMSINFTETITTGRLLHNGGDLSLELNGHTLDLRVSSGITESWSSGVNIATGGEVNINGGRVLCNFAGIANTLGDRSTVILDDPDAVFETRESMRVGAFGDGGLGLSNQASAIVGNDLIIGETGFGDGVLAMNDAGTTISVADQIQVGALGDGVLRVNAGTVATCQELFVAAFEFSVGDVFVEGEGARIDVAGGAGIGFDGLAEVEINSGGTFTAQQLRIGFEPNSSGLVRVQGEGALLEIATDALVGANGAGQIIIRNGGRAQLGELSLNSAVGIANVSVIGATARLDLNDELRIGSFGSALVEVLDEATVSSDAVEINPGGLLKLDRGRAEFTTMVIAQDTLGISATGLEGNGDITGDVTNRGRIAPGPGFVTLPIDGSLTLSQTADLDFEFSMPGVGGENSDTLAVTGDVVLGGTLQLQRVGGLSPTLLQSVPIITGAASVSGRFDDAEIDQPTINELRVIIVSSGTEVNAVATIVGDVTGDALVDAFDIAYLLAAWGTSEHNSDFNDDGVIDASDLAVMLAAWGG